MSKFFLCVGQGTVGRAVCGQILFFQECIVGLEICMPVRRQVLCFQECIICLQICMPLI